MRTRAGTVAAGLLLLLLAAFAWRSVLDSDVGLHLAGGRWIAEHRAVPGDDPFTWTRSDAPYVAYHWLFQLAVHGLDRSFGAPALAGARLVLLLAVGLLLFDILRLRGVSPAAGAAVALLSLLASEWRFSLRPELATWLLGSATLWLLERHRAGRRAPLWLLPAIQLLWVNLHVYVLGFAILGLYVAEEVVRRRSLRTPLVAWTGVALLATLVNPYGLQGVAYPLLLATRLSGENVFGLHIDELVSPLAIAPIPGQPFSMTEPLVAYRILLLLGLAAMVLHVAKRRAVDAALIAVFGTLSLLAVRNLALYALFAAPALATALDDVLEGARARGLRAAPAVVLVAALAWAGLCLPRVVSGSYYAQARRSERPEAVFCAGCLALPAADFVARSDLAGRGLNNLVIGGTLLWRDPERRVFIDGRNEVTGERFYGTYLEAMDPERFPETQRRFGFEYVVLAHAADARAGRLSAALLASPAWRLVFLDGSGVVFVRADGPNAALPEVALPAPVSPEERARALADWPAAPGFAARWLCRLWSTEPPPGASGALGGFLLGVGRPEAAERPLLEVAAAHPDFWEPFVDLGVAYRAQGRTRAASAALHAAYARAPDHPDLAPLGRAVR